MVQFYPLSPFPTHNPAALIIPYWLFKFLMNCCCSICCSVAAYSCKFWIKELACPVNKHLGDLCGMAFAFMGVFCHFIFNFTITASLSYDFKMILNKCNSFKVTHTRQASKTRKWLCWEGSNRWAALVTGIMTSSVCHRNTHTHTSLTAI